MFSFAMVYLSFLHYFYLITIIVMQTVQTGIARRKNKVQLTIKKVLPEKSSGWRWCVLQIIWQLFFASSIILWLLGAERLLQDNKLSLI